MPAEHYAIELVPHRAEWAQMARTESARLKDALGDLLMTVHHIGSTAIAGIMAKPIVDLIPLVTSVEALDGAAPRIEALGYEYLGEFGLPGRRYCRLIDAVSGKRVFQLHCYQPEAPEFPRHLAFRDYLRAHPAIAKAYEAEKVPLPRSILATSSPTTMRRTTGSSASRPMRWHGGSRTDRRPAPRYSWRALRQRHGRWAGRGNSIPRQSNHRFACGR